MIRYLYWLNVLVAKGNR